MRPFVVSKDLLGTKSSLRVEGSSIKKHKETENDFVLGSKTFYPSSIDDLYPIYGFQIPDIVSKELRKSYEFIHGNEIDWFRALGKDKFVKNMRNLSSQVSQSLSKIQNQSYLDTFSKGRMALARLQPCKVDRQKIKSYIESDGEGILQSFLPKQGDYSETVRYSHATATGRLKVQSGPKILTLQKQHRDILVSRFKRGKIAILDFISLEPRTALLLTRNQAPKDIYEAMRHETNSNLNRTKLKIATISSLYGSEKSDPDTMSVVNRFFRTKEIHEKYLQVDKFENLYGRPLRPSEDRLRLSYFIQSTSVDVSLLGFSKILGRFLEMVPLFVIHDALVVDLERDLFEELLHTGIEVEVDPLGKYYLSIQSIEMPN